MSPLRSHQDRPTRKILSVSTGCNYYHGALQTIKKVEFGRLGFMKCTYLVETGISPKVVIIS